MSAISVTFDHTQFTDAMQALAKISGKPYAEIIKREMASACRIVAGGLKITPEKTIRTQVTKRFMAKFETEAGQISDTRRDTWFREEGDDTWIPVGHDALPRMTVKTGPQAGKKLTGTASRGWRVSGFVWGASVGANAKRLSYIAATIPKRLRARFLKLQSWVQIGAAMGIDLNTVPPQTKQIKTDEARDAADRKGRTYRNGTAMVEVNGANAEVTIRNECGPEIATSGQVKLNGALNRRAKAFENNLAHGVFQDIKARCARYPGIFVSGDTPPDNS